MRFTATLSDFNKVLQKTLPAMPRKSTLPILEHLNFSLNGNTLRIIASDQDITIMSSLMVSGEEDGTVLVPGKRISDITKALGDKGLFIFSSSEENFEISIETSFGKYDMKGINPDEYLDLPELFESEKPTIHSKESAVEALKEQPNTAFFLKEDIIRLADKTYFAVSNDEFRPAMTGVLFQFCQNHINAVATDSFRLVKVTVRSDMDAYPADMNIIIPARAVELLRKVDNDVTMTVISSGTKVTHARFDVGDTVFVTRIIDEKFPPYESVIPKESRFLAYVPNKELLAAIRRVAIFTSSISYQIRLKFELNQVFITGEDEDSGTQANELINCEFNDEPFTIGFNYHYLEQALQNIDVKDDSENVVFSFSEANKPVLIKPVFNSEDLVMLIMPVRL